MEEGEFARTFFSKELTLKAWVHSMWILVWLTWSDPQSGEYLHFVSRWPLGRGGHTAKMVASCLSVEK